MNIFNQDIKITRANVANPGERSMMRSPGAYAFANECGLIGIAWANHCQEALDIMADSGMLDCMQMSESDHAEYEANGWSDSFLTAGNASEPFWQEYLVVEQIR